MPRSGATPQEKVQGEQKPSSAENEEQGFGHVRDVEISDHAEGGVFAKQAAAIASSKTLEEARGHFKILSGSAIELAKQHAEDQFTVMHCGMVKGGGADWLQSDASKVFNPYFGSKMPNCGAPKNPAN